LITIPEWIVLPILVIDILKNDKFDIKILPKKVGKFLAIVAKFGSIWQPCTKVRALPCAQ